LWLEYDLFSASLGALNPKKANYPSNIIND